MVPDNETSVFPLPFRKKGNLEGGGQRNYLSIVKAVIGNASQCYLYSSACSLCVDVVTAIVL